MNKFHRVEKWNGRFYQKGALWQVGVKIYAGHDGAPCPKRLASLSGYAHVVINHADRGNVLSEVAHQMQMTEADVVKAVSEVLDQPIGTMNKIGRDIVTTAAEKCGMDVLELLQYLKGVVYQGAEDDAAKLHAASNQATAEAEVEVSMNDHQDNVLAIPLEIDFGGDDDWEDEDERPRKGSSQRFLPRPPPTDGTGNSFLTVVHTNGIHSLPIVWCACDEHQEDRDLQLLDQHLYPASYDQIKTVFTFACLDDHRYDYLECKSSHYQYHNKLKRWTCPEYPAASSNRYAELCRVARQWRNLKYRKWFWMLHNMNGKRGEMALFCAACPQDGINLEENWETEQASNP